MLAAASRTPPEEDAGEGTDFYAIRHGFVSITPLRIDLTAYQEMERLQQGLKDLL